MRRDGGVLRALEVKRSCAPRGGREDGCGGCVLAGGSFAEMMSALPDGASTLSTRCFATLRRRDDRERLSRQRTRGRRCARRCRQSAVSTSTLLTMRLAIFLAACAASSAAAFRPSASSSLRMSMPLHRGRLSTTSGGRRSALGSLAGGALGAFASAALPQSARAEEMKKLGDLTYYDVTPGK